MNLRLISKYRKECMGLAILFVLGVHSLDFGIPYPAPVAKALSYGQIGVNIFFLLSGLGMFYSLQKGAGGFYQKRARRILPSYLMIAIPAFFAVDILLDGEGLGVWALDLSTLRYWLCGVGYWYVAVQIVMYLLIPLHHAARGRFGRTVNPAILVASIILGHWLKARGMHQIGRFFERYAVFIGGYWLGEFAAGGRTYPLIGVAFAIASVWLKSFARLPAHHGLINATLALAGFGICCLFSQVLEKAPWDGVRRGFAFLGGCTLETYMMNVTFNWILLRLQSRWSEIVPPAILYWCVSGAGAVAIAWLVQRWAQRFSRNPQRANP